MPDGRDGVPRLGGAVGIDVVRAVIDDGDALAVTLHREGGTAYARGRRRAGLGGEEAPAEEDPFVGCDGDQTAVQRCGTPLRRRR